MTFGTVEMSRQGGVPASLYLFVWGVGPTAFYAYTDADEQIVFDGKTYEPLPIGRANSIRSAGGLDKTTLMLDTTLDSEIAKLYTASPPSKPTTIVIRQGHIGDGDYKIVFSGRVVGVNREGPLARVLCEPFSTTMRHPGLRRNYQYGCPLVLYDGMTCRADPEAVKQTAVVDALSKFTVTPATGWNGVIAEDRFPGGYIQWTDAAGNTQIRTIVSVAAGVLTLARKVTDLAVTDSIDILPGCNHQVSDCRDLHKEIGTGNSNIVNYGGQKDIPVENPVGFAKNFFY